MAQTHRALIPALRGRPHKIAQISWNEYRFEGDVITLEDADGREEAFQMMSMRSSPTEEWLSARWKLVKVTSDYGEFVSQPQWMVEAVFANEPDTKEDVEFLRSKGPVDSALRSGLETPRWVVHKVMRSLRDMNDPYPLHGAAVATRYCSPRNRASELSPAVFARYLEDPWYAILVEWDDIEEDDDEDEEDAAGSAEVEVLVRRDGEDSFTMVCPAERIDCHRPEPSRATLRSKHPPAHYVRPIRVCR